MVEATYGTTMIHFDRFCPLVFRAVVACCFWSCFFCWLSSPPPLLDSRALLTLCFSCILYFPRPSPLRPLAADGTVRKWWAHVLPAQTLLSEVFMYAQMAYNNPDNPANKQK